MDVDLGRFVKLAINHEVVQLLGEGRGSTCVNTDQSFDNCMYEAIENITMKEVGCTVPWLRSSLEKTNPK